MLTDTQIRKSKALRLPDSGGLYLVNGKRSDKLWRYKYRFQGREKLMSFGKYPDVPLATARERHAAARRLLADGIDPMAARKAERAERTEKVAINDAEGSFEDIASHWFIHWKGNKSAQHVDTTWRRLQANVFPEIGHFNVKVVAAPHLVRMVKAIEARGVGDLAKRALETCGQIFRYAVAHGYCERNPAADIKPADVLKPYARVHMARVGESELPGLLRAIEVYRGAVLTRLACKLMALTFVRTSELIGARWEEFDLAGRRWNIPKERMKMKAPHIVPLSTQAVEVLGLLRTYFDRETDGRWISEVPGTALQYSSYLFPGERAGVTMSNNTILFALRRMGYGGVMTGHGFRGLASTLLHEQGWPHDHIELQLAHAPRNAVSAAYNHALYLEPRARMMQAWGDYLEQALRGKA